MDLDLDRGQSAAHMSFGSGIHRCVGLHLARQEFHVVARRVLERIPDYVVDEAAVKPYERQSDMQGLSVAPATFTPGPRVLDIPSDDPMLTYQAHA
jgi:cytochrome P450